MRLVKKKQSVIHNIWTATLIATVLFILLTILGVVIVTIMVSKGILMEQSMAWAAIPVWLLAGVCSTIIPVKLMRENRIISVLIVLILSMIVLGVITLVFFSGEYKEVGKGIGVIAISALPALFMINKKPKSATRQKYRNR